MESYTISDADGRAVRFVGELLGSASTKERDSLRWSETNVYRTRAGNFILQKVGRTVIFHRVDGCKYGMEMMLGDVPPNLLPCPVCKPAEVDTTYTIKVKAETNRYTVHTSETAQGLIESARTTDEDGATYMTRVCREAIEQASEHDQHIRDAYMVRVVE